MIQLNLFSSGIWISILNTVYHTVFITFALEICYFSKQYHTVDIFLYISLLQIVLI